MYVNKPSVTKVVAADRVNLLHSTSCRFEQLKNVENLVKCLYPAHICANFHDSQQKTLAFRHIN